MAMDIASDGRVFQTDRWGTLRIYEPATEEMVVAGELDTYTDRYPDGNNEGGLLAVALDPGFDENQWIYLYYAHPVELHIQLSRFEMDGNTLNLESEIVMLEVP